jgi:hypothetical protein
VGYGRLILESSLQSFRRQHPRPSGTAIVDASLSVDPPLSLQEVHQSIAPKIRASQLWCNSYILMAPWHLAIA